MHSLLPWVPLRSTHSLLNIPFVTDGNETAMWDSRVKTQPYLRPLTARSESTVHAIQLKQNKLQMQRRQHSSWFENLQNRITSTNTSRGHHPTMTTSEIYSDSASRVSHQHSSR
ncbi:hypothetical protein COOONC_00852 [Cooperia oncophora]